MKKIALLMAQRDLKISQGKYRSTQCSDQCSSREICVMRLVINPIFSIQCIPSHEFQFSPSLLGDIYSSEMRFSGKLEFCIKSVTLGILTQVPVLTFFLNERTKWQINQQITNKSSVSTYNLLRAFWYF